MSKWRPKGWIKVKTKAHSSLIEAKGKGLWPCFDDDYMEAGADAMLEKVCGEIEKVENSYTGVIGEYFEECRQKILTLFRSEE